MLQQLRLFFIALQFFTRLPIPRWVGFQAAWLQHSGRYFPAVGILLGMLSAGVYAAAAMLWPQPVAVLLSTIAGIWLTGAFHEDGFADTCDGFGGGQTRERVLEIMRDSRIGAYGAIGIGLMLALKCLLLASLPPAAVVAALLLAHPLSRLAAVTLIWRMEYAREEGKAKPLAQAMSGAEYAIALLTVVLPGAAFCYFDGLDWRAPAAGCGAMLLSTLWLARLFRRRIGGFTGDCLGAVQQMAEVVFYLALLAVVTH